MRTEAVDLETGKKIAVEIESDKVEQLYREWKSQELPKRKLERGINNLPISADAKAFLALFMDKAIQVGDRILRVGRRIIEIALDFAKQYPRTTFGLILGLIVSMLISSIPILGAILGPLLNPLILLFALGKGFVEDMRDHDLYQKIEAIRSFDGLKGAA